FEVISVWCCACPRSKSEELITEIINLTPEQQEALTYHGGKEV
ncbi:hypothetical protein LCGC14_2765480, partial [marine sediment metagenome]